MNAPVLMEGQCKQRIKTVLYVLRCKTTGMVLASIYAFSSTLNDICKSG